MAWERFVKAASDGRRDIKYRRICRDRIPGTNKIRTYVSNHEVYSPESDLSKITRMPYVTKGSRIDG